MAAFDFKVVKNDRVSTVQLPATSAAASFPARRSSVVSFQLVLAVAGLVIGLLLAMQLHSASQKSSQPASRDSTRQEVSASIARFEQEQDSLKSEVTALRAKLNDLQQQSAATRSLSNIQQTLKNEQIGSGLVPLHGPGLIVTFDDSKASNIPADDDLAHYIIHEYDLRDGINALLGAGAEAISLNGERLVGSSSVYCVGSTIIVNSTRLSPPYNLNVIGKSAAMDDALFHSAQMGKFLQRRDLYGVIMTVVPSGDIYIPEYTNAPNFKYATPVEGQGQ